MSTPSVILINTLRAEAGKQQELIDLLKRNIDNVVSTLAGWKSSRLIASDDGQKVIIHSEWQSPDAVAAMRADPRMQAYFPQIRALASFDSVVGTEVFARAS